MKSPAQAQTRSIFVVALMFAMVAICAAPPESAAQSPQLRSSDIVAVVDRLASEGQTHEAGPSPSIYTEEAIVREHTASPEDSLASGRTVNSEGQRARFVAHFMGWSDPSRSVPLLYASPTAFEWPFEKELDDIRSAEALVRNWTRYRDDDVVVEMDPLSTSVRIVLPLNRALKGSD